MALATYRDPSTAVLNTEVGIRSWLVNLKSERDIDIGIVGYIGTLISFNSLIIEVL
jgi:hypothetical protein